MKPIYVGDVTRAIISCPEKDKLKTEYFISGSTEVTYSQFIDAITRAMTLGRGKVRIPYFITFIGVSFVSRLLKSFPITVDALKRLVNPWVYDSDDAEMDIDFNPLALEQGMERAFDQVEGDR